MLGERAFYHFDEAPITFKPTYKFLVGTSDYDLKYGQIFLEQVRTAEFLSFLGVLHRGVTEYFGELKVPIDRRQDG